MHWAEEVELLKEEMWRILQFFEWRAQCWDERGLEDALHNVVDDDEHKGLFAYAKRQASLCQRLTESFRTSWTDTLALVDSFNNSLVTQQDKDID
jgi:hypothetical protein